MNTNNQEKNSQAQQPNKKADEKKAFKEGLKDENFDQQDEPVEEKSGNPEIDMPLPEPDKTEKKIPTMEESEK